MPVPVFEPAKPKQQESKQPPKEKISGGAAFFALLFVIMLSITVELSLLDVNRLFNPNYEQCQSQQANIIQRVFDTSRDPSVCDVQRYEAARLLLHADIVVPLILLCILIVVILNMQKRNLVGRIFRVTLIIFSSWISFRIMYEALAFSLKHYPLYGKYFVLLTAIAASIVMTIWLQRTVQKKNKTE